jgi:preprotein translocase subunit SecE
MADSHSERRRAQRAARLARPQAPPVEERRRSNFFAESWGELKKVEWPSQNHVIQGTIAVIVACVIVGFFIWVADIAWKHLVQEVLLR